MPETPSETELLVDSVVNASNDMIGRVARIQIDGNIVEVSTSGDDTRVVIETSEGARHSASMSNVTLLN